MSVIWHDLECGAYGADLPLWRSLAHEHGGPVLDVGAGTGRVTVALARDGFEVVALDLDPELLAELEVRAGGLPVQTVLADAREFALGREFALCLVPMQTVQLLGGEAGRLAFLRCARRHLRPGGVVALALTEQLDPFELASGALGPLPDVCEHDGVVYSSAPTAVVPEDDGFVLERRREIVSADGELSRELDRIRLDRVTAAELEREATQAGLEPALRLEIPATDDHVASRVVVLRG